MTGTVADRSGDAALMLEVAAGSESALAALYDRHADAIFAAARRSTSDGGLAEEVVQETFLALWDRADRFDPTMGSLASWLHAIARNRMIDRLRAAGRRPTLVPLSGTAPGGEAADADTLEWVLHAGSMVAAGVPTAAPDAAAVLGELRRELQGAVAAMPEDERTVIVLAYGDDLSQAEIAERLGWPLGTVKTRTRRALGRLRRVLDERDLRPMLDRRD
ncbi:MAG: RNA polymerase sigma factor [Candidatus Limnocylindria bacterium]